MLKHLLFIGSFPPPYHGSNIDNENLITYWDSSRVKLSVLDISLHQKSGFEMSEFSIRKILTVLKTMKPLFTSILKGVKYDFAMLHLA